MSISGIESRKIAGAILAGGAGQRLGGVCKAQLRVKNRTLLAYAEAFLRPQVESLFVSIGEQDPSRFKLNAKITLVADGEFAGLGPIAGLFAVAAHMHQVEPETEFLATIAVDTPVLPDRMADLLYQALGRSHSVAMASCDGQVFPTHAVWRLADVVALSREPQKQVGKGLRHLVEADKQCQVPFPASHQPLLFANINAPGDLIKFARAFRTADKKK